jgi:hypothetical protein
MATNISGTLGVDKIDPALIATTAEAQAGTNNTKLITALRLREGVNATGTAPIFAARAWVNFDGTGTVAIRASGNVSGITDNGTGNYTVNFLNAMPDADYAVTATTSFSATGVANLRSASGNTQRDKQTSGFRLLVFLVTNTDILADPKIADLAIFR